MSIRDMMDPRSVRKVRVRQGMHRIAVPVDEDGYVPKWALVQRYQQLGDRRDRTGTAKMVLPERVTPQQVVRSGWWNDPGCCDISGIDTKSPRIYDVPDDIKGAKRRALANVPVLTEDPDEAARIKRLLAQSFTAKQLNTMFGRTEDAPVIGIEERLDGCTGAYIRKQNGIPVPLIVFEAGTTPDGINHEIVHHERAMDGRTAFPSTKNGRLKNGRMAVTPRQSKQKMVVKEESETVAETVAITGKRPDRRQSGYYDNVKGKSPRTAYVEDFRRLNRGHPAKGLNAMKRLEEEYSSSNIGSLYVESISVDKRKKRKQGAGK